MRNKSRKRKTKGFRSLLGPTVTKAGNGPQNADKSVEEEQTFQDMNDTDSSLEMTSASEELKSEKEDGPRFEIGAQRIIQHPKNETQKKTQADETAKKLKPLKWGNDGDQRFRKRRRGILRG